MKKRRITIYDLQYWFNKGYNEEDALVEIARVKKETSCWSKEFWIKKGLSLSEAEEKVKEVQSKNAKQRKSPPPNAYSEDFWKAQGYTDPEKIRLRIEEQKVKTNPYLQWTEDKKEDVMKKRRETYYAKSDEERKAINKSRGRKKEQVIEKFGMERYLEILAVRKAGLTFTPPTNQYSKISKKLFDELSVLNPDRKFYYADEEWFVRNTKYAKIGYSLDFFCPATNKIIEFNGDFYHANPDKFLPESRINKFGVIHTAAEIWERDSQRMEVLKELGYTILVIWEHEYMNFHEQTIQKCNTFLNTK